MVPLFIVLSVIVVLIVVSFIFSYIRRWQQWKKSLKGKVVLVTGSANGLGKQLCLLLAQEQCHLICVDIDEKANKNTVQEIRKICNTIHIRAYTVDITSRDQISRLKEDVFNEYPMGIDILINNAGLVYPSRLLTLTDAHVERVMNTNCVSHLWLIRAFLPKMLERNSGHIVCTGSLAIFLKLDSMVPYYGSKFGVWGIMEALTFELACMRSKIKTLIVHPTLMHTQLLPKKLYDLGTGIKLINKLPVQIVDPKDVAQGVIKSIKDGRRVYYHPYYHHVFLQLLNLLPQFLLDLVYFYCARIDHFLDPLEPLK